MALRIHKYMCVAECNYHHKLLLFVLLVQISRKHNTHRKTFAEVYGVVYQNKRQFYTYRGWVDGMRVFLESIYIYERVPFSNGNFTYQVKKIGGWVCVLEIWRKNKSAECLYKYVR